MDIMNTMCLNEFTNVDPHSVNNVQIVGELIINDNAVIFLPGMTATVDVLSGKRTVFEYIWQPMAKIGELALRD